ncbi:MAG: DedA family protein [Phycisphaerales bacterium]|nr:DedA family protein [Phycisphaerales bacterium]
MTGHSRRWLFVQGLLVALAILFTPCVPSVHGALEDQADTSQTDATADQIDDEDSSAYKDLPYVPRNPNSFKGRIETKVETGLINYGPLLLFGLLMASGVGLALGEDIFIVPAGFLMQRDIMPFWWTAMAAYFGVVFADTIWVVLVRRFSRTILRFRFFRRMFHPRRILEIKYKFDRWGVWVVVVSRFIPFSRTPVFTAAGLSRMNIWKFMLAEGLAAIPVVAAQLGVGWLIGMGFSMSERQKHIQEIIIGSLILLAIILVFWLWRRKKRRKIRAPRAPIAWLRQAIGRPVRPRSRSKD